MAQPGPLIAAQHSDPWYPASPAALMCVVARPHDAAQSRFGGGGRYAVHAVPQIRASTQRGWQPCSPRLPRLVRSPIEVRQVTPTILSATRATLHIDISGGAKPLSRSANRRREFDLGSNQTPKSDLDRPCGVADAATLARQPAQIRKGISQSCQCRPPQPSRRIRPMDAVTMLH